MTAPVFHVAKGKTWENWHESVRQKVTQLVDVWNGEPNRATIANYNATTTGLQGLIGQALAGSLQIRALGGGWAFTPVAATDGILLNTKPLNYQFRLADANLHANYKGRGDNLVFAQCGVSIAELNTTLLARGKSMRTTGASNGQTIAGAISCGTHGSAFDGGAIHDSVAALHIVTAPDRHVWIERATNPLASDSLVAAVGAQLVRDDATFDAALVSFGSFGVVHGVVLEVDDLFYLQDYRKQYPNAPGTWAAVEKLDFTAAGLPRGAAVRPYFFQALFNPYDRQGGPYLTAMYRDAARPAGAPGPNLHDKWRPGDSIADLVGGATDLSSGLTPAVAPLLLHSLYPDVNGIAGTWGEMFWDTSSRGKLASTALGVPLDRLREAVTALYDLNDKFKIPGFFAVRYVKASRAPLAFTRHAPTTAVLEVDGAFSKRMMDFYQAAWDKMDALKIPTTYHWGKMQPFDAARVVRMYGKPAVDQWRGARKALLTTPKLRAVFSNALLASLKLDT